MEPTVFKASNLTISTCTVITNLNSKINLGLFSRFVDIYDQSSQELDKKNGGIYNLEFYGNCARGETLIDKIKDEFNNHETIKFKYWGFRNINIKVFANGKLQMTGLKYEDEAKEVGQLLIDILNKMHVKVLKDITKVGQINTDFDFQLVYNPETKTVNYYRKYYDRFMEPYKAILDSELYKPIIVEEETPTAKKGKRKIQIKQINNQNDNNIIVDFARKGYIKEIHDKYLDNIENEYETVLNKEAWSGDNYIKKSIDKIERIKNRFTSELETILSNSKDLPEVKKGVETMIKKYTDFTFSQLDKILYDIGKNGYPVNEQTMIDVKCEIFKYNKLYRQQLEKKINRLIMIRTIDITICHYINKYLETLSEEELKVFPDILSIPINKINVNVIPQQIPLTNTVSTINEINIECQEDIKQENVDIKQEEIKEEDIKQTEINYFVSGTETVLINSDLSINHNINLKRMSKVLKKLGLFNSYEPDEYPGVLTKYYFNPDNKIQGICNCTPHCSTKEKHSICTKITISIFRPGSVIITGARNTVQLMSAHDLIIKILKENIDIVKTVPENDDEEHKQIALLNNEFRKISKKTRLFYVKKSNIIGYDKIND